MEQIEVDLLGENLHNKWNDFVEYESLPNENTNDIDSECQTKEYHEEITYEWLIENFNPKLYSTGEVIQSKTFPNVNFYNFDQYNLRIYPRFGSTNFRDETTLTKHHHTSSRSQLTLAESSFYCPDEHHTNPVVNTNSCDAITLSIVPIKDLNQTQVANMKVNVSYMDSKNNIIYTEPIYNVQFTHNIREIRLHRLKKTDLDARSRKDDKDLHILFKCSLSANIIDENSNNRSRFGFRSRCILWHIRDYERLFRDHYVGSFIESDIIDFSNEQFVNDQKINSKLSKFSDHYWSLNLYPRGKDRQYEDMVSLFIKHETDYPIIAKCEIKFYDEDRQKITGYELPTRLFDGCRRWGVGDCFPILDIVKRIECKSLIIECRIKMLNSTTTNLKNATQSKRQLRSAHEQRLYQIFKSQKYFDLCVIAREGCHGTNNSQELTKTTQHFSFLVHRVIFAAASEYIEKLIDKNGGDRCDTLELKECSYDSLRLLVAFLYKRRIDKYLTYTSTCDLIRVTCAYEIRGLLYDTLETYLIQNTNCDTIFDLLRLFDMNSKGLTNKLKQYVVDFISKHSLKILDTLQWKRLKDEKPEIVETFLKILLKKNNLEK